MPKIMWIHKQANWPRFTYACLDNQLAEAQHNQEQLIKRVKKLSPEHKLEMKLRMLTSDVISTSTMQKKTSNAKKARSTIARCLGIAGLDDGEHVFLSRDVKGIVDIMLDVTRNFSTPLTEKRLFEWHAALFPSEFSGIARITVADWRSPDKEPMRVVSGVAGKQKVHYEAPAAERVESEMAAFLKWFEHNTVDNPLLKAGIALLWFESIHPFEGGNGRIGRAIADMALARADGVADRFYSMSTQIKAEQKEYYRQLESQQRRPPDLTGWLEWFLACYLRALQRAEQVLARVLFKAQLWEKINRQPVNPRQRTVINRMLEDEFHGHMNTSKYARMSKCSADTALRDMQQLQKRRILTRNPSGGRSTSYRLTDDASAVE